MLSLEASAGSLVWVRRRNGSWWPGKILSIDEVSDSHLISPRSGTPVRLLGKKDASVDWYNLERSKRIKAFRCGDFDDCIGMVESSNGMPAKKREKYARREDAILHALELEREMLKKDMKLGELQSGVACRSKRSKCVYVQVESDNPPLEMEAPSARTNGVDEEASSSATESIKTEPDADVAVSEVAMQRASQDPLLDDDEDDDMTGTGHSRSTIYSKWKMKGKRNVRSTSRRPIDESIAIRAGIDEKIPTSTRRLKSLSSNFDDCETGSYDEAQDSRRRHTGKQRLCNRYLMEEISFGRKKSVLVDVDLKVQASYQEHVPIVSLLSKYNGNAIIGHPIRVEALEDGSTDCLENGEIAAIPSVWKTARRTSNFRVPRLLPMSTIEDDEVEDTKRRMKKKARIGNGGQRANPSRKNSAKVTKTVSFASNRKIRTLSSLASAQAGGKGIKRASSSYDPNNVVKPDSWATDIACVPVRLVFTRLLEAISRPGSV